MAKQQQQQQAQIHCQVFYNIQPIIVLGRLLGLCPITYKQSGNKYIINKSKYWIIFGCFQTIILTCISIWGALSDFTNNQERSIKMKSILDTFVNFANTLIVSITTGILVSVLLTPSRLRSLFAIFDKMYKIDQEIPPQYPKNYRQHCTVTIITVIILGIGLMCYDIVGWLGFSYENLNKLKFFCYYYGTSYIVILIGILQEVYLWYLMNFLHIRLQSLNYWMERKKQQLQDSSNYQFFTVKFNNSSKNYNNFTMADVLQLTKNHEILCEIADCLSDLRGIPSLLTVSNCFLHLIITPYFMFMELSQSNFKFTLLQLIWIVTHTIRLIAIVEPCHRCNIENDKIISKIFSFMNFNLNADVKRQLIMLVQLIVYRTSDFSPCGFFSLNRSLITAVAGSVMTYLIILVQFRDE